jgi:anti-sigma factor RsiW
MLTQWQANHLSDEVLVSLLDGELPPGKRRAARKHVDQCWACRTRLAEFESQIQQFTRLLRDQSDPPPAWIFRARQRFQERARPIRERAEGTQGLDRPGWLSGLRLNPGVTAAAVGLLAVLAFLWLHNPDRVSAHELLRQAIASDRSAARVPSGKAVRQRVQLRGRSRRTGREMTAVRECWLGVPPPAEPAAANPLMDELRGVYRVNGLDWDAPLSVASVARWRAGLRSPSEHVATGDSFVLTVRDRATTHHDRQQLRSIRLFLGRPTCTPSGRRWKPWRRSTRSPRSPMCSSMRRWSSGPAVPWPPRRRVTHFRRWSRLRQPNRRDRWWIAFRSTSPCTRRAPATARGLR